MKFSTKGKNKETPDQDQDHEGEDEDAYNLQDLEGTGLTQDEQAGVLHLVHGWIQQNQPKKVFHSQFNIHYTQPNLNPNLLGSLYIRGYKPHKHHPSSHRLLLTFNSICGHDFICDV